MVVGMAVRIARLFFVLAVKAVIVDTTTALLVRLLLGAFAVFSGFPALTAVVAGVSFPLSVDSLGAVVRGGDPVISVRSVCVSVGFS